MALTTSINRPTKDRLADTGDGWHRSKLYSGFGYSFDGVNDYIDVGDISQNCKTLMFLIKSDFLTHYVIDLDGGTHYTTVSGGVITADGFTDATIYIDGIENNTITTNAWYHVTITTETAIDVTNLDIGRVGANYYTGSISNVLIFDEVLNYVQVFNSYTNPESPVPPGVLNSSLVAWYPLNENNAAVTHVIDHSITSPFGVINGASLVTAAPAPTIQSIVSGYTDYYWFDGSNDYISISGITNDFDINGYFEMTIGFYMPSAAAGVFSSTVDTNNRFSVQRVGANFLVGTYDGTTTLSKSTTTFIDNKFYIVTLTVNNKAVTAFLDGVEMTTTGTGFSHSSVANTTIGMSTNGTAIPYTGVVTSIEQTGVHRWTNKGGWVDEIGTDDGTINGSPTTFRLTKGITRNKDPFSYALNNLKGIGYFQGNEYASTPHTDNLDITTAITLAGWVYIETTGAQKTVIAKNLTYELAVSSGETVIMSIYQTTNKFILSNATLSADTWHYLVGTYTSGTMNIYIDAVLDKTSSSYTGAIDSTSAAVETGTNNGSTKWPGRLDEVKVYDRVLSVNEIVTNYRAGLDAHP